MNVLIAVLLWVSTTPGHPADANREFRPGVLACHEIAPEASADLHLFGPEHEAPGHGLLVRLWPDETAFASESSLQTVEQTLDDARGRKSLQGLTSHPTWINAEPPAAPPRPCRTTPLRC